MTLPASDPGREYHRAGRYEWAEPRYPLWLRLLIWTAALALSWGVAVGLWILAMEAV